MSYPSKAELTILADRTARLAKVPADNQQEFCERIIKIISDLRLRDRRSTGKKPGGRLIEAAEAARILDLKFSGMNSHDRTWVEDIHRTRGVVFANGEIHHLATTITNIAMLLHDALGKSYPVPKHLELGSHRVVDQRLRELIFGMLSAACPTGGRFTFNKNSASGSLAVTLDKLRSHLPRDLVPGQLSGATIQRLKTEFERLRRN
jgi:hypothetical protein